MWETIQQGTEIFAYVLNLASNGDGYWVFAHVTPSFDSSGTCIGYHSNRRVPAADALPKVTRLYAELTALENRHDDRRNALQASTGRLNQVLEAAGQTWDEFVFSLSQNTCLERVMQ